MHQEALNPTSVNLPHQIIHLSPAVTKHSQNLVNGTTGTGNTLGRDRPHRPQLPILYLAQHPCFCLVHPCTRQKLVLSSKKAFSTIASWPAHSPFCTLLAKGNTGITVFQKAQARASESQVCLINCFDDKDCCPKPAEKAHRTSEEPMPTAWPLARAGSTGMFVPGSRRGFGWGGKLLEPIPVSPLTPSSALPRGQSCSGFCHHSCLLS